MISEETYRNLIRKLKESKVSFDKEEELKQQLIQQISSSKNEHNTILRSFYGWTEIRWLRWSISTAAILFITLFFTQQLAISKRLQRLEGQLVQTENSVITPESSIAPSHRVLWNMISDKKLDSITVSKSDLDAFLKEYVNLQEELKDLKNNNGLDKSSF